MSTAKPAGHDAHKHDSDKSPKPKTRRRRWLRTLGIAFAGVVLVAGLSLGGAEYYTARPDFCGTCHVMDPYYKSWSHDRHGAKLDVWCVQCHYAPGEQHTIKAKFKGLSQVASYFSGRYGTARPRAHVNNNSCLTSGCHGGGEFLTKKITIGAKRTESRQIVDRSVPVERIPTVHYSHEKHLKVDERFGETTQALETLKARLRKKLTIGQFEAVEKAVSGVGAEIYQPDRLTNAVGESAAQIAADDAAEWARLEHTRIRLAQLKGITCAACHTYDATGEHHMRVDVTTCFTCHFTGQAFNRETGACLKCHEPPVRRIAIHTGGIPTSDGAGMMDHRDIVSRGIDCVSCHAELVRGGLGVTLRECAHCHDSDRYTKNFDTRTTATVEEYHTVHVAMGRARCSDCHRTIEHKLAEPEAVAASTAPLRPVLEDCAHCHPNHHSEQVKLLMGVGGSGIDTPMPNAMFGSRMNCRACHRQSGSDFKGDALVAATKNACVACHSADYEKLFDQWNSELTHSVDECEKARDRLKQRLETLKSAGKPAPPNAADVLKRAEINIRLVKSGHGIHNKNYALKLLDLTTRELDDAIMRTTN